MSTAASIPSAPRRDGTSIEGARSIDVVRVIGVSSESGISSEVSSESGISSEVSSESGISSESGEDSRTGEGSTGSREFVDHVAVEEPLAIQVTHGPIRARDRTTISVTMRTPGHDEDLAAGLLFTEGVVSQREQILAIVTDGASRVRVDLHPEVPLDWSRLDRRGFTTSSCGVCGKTSIEAVEVACDGPRPGGARIPAAVVHTLPGRLRAAQPAFASTGGLHAAAIFDFTGKLVSVRKDVGRHNAVDKLIGAALLRCGLPLDDRLIFVSGRASFELVQKAAMAGAPILAAVGAPSSLAIQLAERLGVTLLGFVRDGRFNIYTRPERVGSHWGTPNEC